MSFRSFKVTTNDTNRKALYATSY